MIMVLVFGTLWPRQATVMKNQRLRGDISGNIPGRIILYTALPHTAIYL